LKVFRKLIFYFLISTLFGFSLGADNLFPIETSAFFHENLLGSQSSTPSESGFSTYQDSAGYTVKYPSEWQKIEPEEQGYIGFVPTEGGASFVVGAHSVNYSSVDSESENSLRILLSEVNKAIIEDYSSNKTGFKLLESNMTAIDGNPASKLVFVLKSGAGSEKEMKHTILSTLKDDMRYTVTSTVGADEYDNYVPTFQKMFDSIKLTDLMY
jgi:PsbP-like protein